MKRAVDVLLVALTAPVWGPLLLLVAGTVWAAEGRPVFFTQMRAGRGGRPFRLLKFRTMRAGEGCDAARLTRFGLVLRASSLDELPELLHVLAGTMALVGPRPLPVRYLPRYTAEQSRRHVVRPGITGWAQVHGRNGIDWDEKFRLDVWYVDHRSMALDFKILLMTVGAVVSARGVSAPGDATMAEFQGKDAT